MKKFEEFKRDLDRAKNHLWVFKLNAAFDILNKNPSEHLGTALIRPNFHISKDKSYLGSWTSSERRLSLNIDLLQKSEWDKVLAVLRHEMAHMIVEEIYRTSGVIEENRPHGELFRKACKVMDADPCEIDRVNSLSSLESKHAFKIVDKARKLLALGESPNKREAELAIAKAHELMVRHNISNLELRLEERTFTARPVSSEWKRVPSYVKILAGIIEKYYFVNHVFCLGENGRYLEFFGEPSNLEIAEYVFRFLLFEGQRQWKLFKLKNKFMPNEGINIKYSQGAFISGVYEGFSEKLRERDTRVMMKIDPKNTLPIGSADPLLKMKVKEHYPRLAIWHSSGGYNGEGRRAGRKVGSGISLHQGLKQGNNQSKRKLLN